MRSPMTPARIINTKSNVAPTERSESFSIGSRYDDPTHIALSLVVSHKASYSIKKPQSFLNGVERIAAIWMLLHANPPRRSKRNGEGRENALTRHAERDQQIEDIGPAGPLGF